MLVMKFRLKLLLVIASQYGRVPILEGYLLIEIQERLGLNMMDSTRLTLEVWKPL